MLPENLSTLRVVDLKEELSKRNLPLKGKKDELIARLQQSLDDEKQKEGATEEPPTDTSAQVDNASKDTTTEENQPQPSDEKTAPTQETIQHKEPVKDVTTDDKNTTHTTTTTTMPKEEKSLEEDDRGTKRKRSVDEKEEVKEPQPEKRTKSDIKHPEEEEQKQQQQQPQQQPQQQQPQPQPEAKEEQQQPKENTVTSSAIYIKGFVRPLIVRHVQELIGKYGTVRRFWMDAIKTHCYVIYESTEEAKAAFEGIDGIVFPRDTGKQVTVGGLTPEQAEVLIEQEQSAADRRIKIDWEGAIESVIKGEVKEVNKSPSSSSNSPDARRPRLFGISQITRELQKAATASVLASENNAAASSTLDERPTNLLQDNVEGQSMLVAEDNKMAAPTASLDELFRKTKATPHLYYLPVSEEIAQQRLEKLKQKTA
ncbi:hypothetical protein RO3G_06496 [Lichtheimia corymbifera JMRC:FSU:9682]|uniref:SAP domain-containing protein n=1 Tax=Lichtheimia corymbifera JMRC:FSU:9682 TaxID=1263082 RepID=A0A068RGL9_9FUNG|nr:hypothetical protein RO3G_06496 [Lichtheimia corymbifera JMRC:FSU:9682]